MAAGQRAVSFSFICALNENHKCFSCDIGMWTLDPIDGTKGFLRGEQYAVCLALIIDARVELGVIGCPNLPLEIGKEDGERGALFVAVRGQGSEQVWLRTRSC